MKCKSRVNTIIFFFVKEKKNNSRLVTSIFDSVSQTVLSRSKFETRLQIDYGLPKEPAFDKLFTTDACLLLFRAIFIDQSFTRKFSGYTKT